MLRGFRVWGTGSMQASVVLFSLGYSLNQGAAV